MNGAGCISDTVMQNLRASSFRRVPALQGRGCVGIPAEAAAFGAAIKVVPQAFVDHTPVLVNGKGRRFSFAGRIAAIFSERNRGK